MILKLEGCHSDVVSFHELEHEPLALEIRKKLLAASPSTIDHRPALEASTGAFQKVALWYKVWKIAQKQIPIKTLNLNVT